MCAPSWGFRRSEVCPPFTILRHARAMEITTQLATMRAAKTQGLAQIAVIRTQHDMETSLIAMIDAVARSAPPPGQGTRVDKSA